MLEDIELLFNLDNETFDASVENNLSSSSSSLR